jgi:hypothetical protein
MLVSILRRKTAVYPEPRTAGTAMKAKEEWRVLQERIRNVIKYALITKMNKEFAAVDGGCSEKKCFAQDLPYRSPYLEMDIHSSYGGLQFKIMNRTTHFTCQYLASHSHERRFSAWSIWIVFLFVSIDSYSVDTYQVGWLVGLLIKQLYI